MNFVADWAYRHTRIKTKHQIHAWWSWKTNEINWKQEQQEQSETAYTSAKENLIRIGSPYMDLDTGLIRIQITSKL